MNWVLEAHSDAQKVWRNDDNGPVVLDDAYYQQALPILDRELGEAGLRLASLINDAFRPGACVAS